MNKEITLEQVKKALASKFIKSDDFAETLYLSYKTGKNAMFWGPGGYAKSEMAKYFFDAFGIDVFVQALGDGSQEETLLGGINLAALKDAGKIEYLVENSFMNYEYVIFEELLDCPSSVLLRLKDILTSGWFRNGTQQFKIKTKMIVALTNRNREEVAEDRSVAALMERFPLDLHVVWDSHEAKDYSMMYKKVLGKDFPVLAEAVAESHKTSHISPRTAIHAAQVYTVGGFKALHKITGFDPKVINKLAQNEKKIMEEIQVKEQLDQIFSYATHLVSNKKNVHTIGELLALSANLDYMNSQLATLNVTDKNVGMLKSIQDLIRTEGEQIAKTGLATVKVAPEVENDVKNLLAKNYENLSTNSSKNSPA